MLWSNNPMLLRPPLRKAVAPNPRLCSSLDLMHSAQPSAYVTCNADAVERMQRSSFFPRLSHISMLLSGGASASHEPPQQPPARGVAAAGSSVNASCAATAPPFAPASCSGEAGNASRGTTPQVRR